MLTFRALTRFQLSLSFDNGGMAQGGVSLAVMIEEQLQFVPLDEPVGRVASAKEGQAASC
jgi:hypothetical protein